VKAAIVPIDFDEACAFVVAHHRNHEAPQGHKFSLALAERREIGDTRPGGAGYGMHVDVIVGVVIVGRPVARGNQDGWTLEATRCATDGTRNACSKLYRAAWRATHALGYRRLITYNKPEEGGASLRGAGFRVVHQTKGGNWNTPARPRVDTDQLLRGQKVLWEVAA
jgi:hypothetical protein